MEIESLNLLVEIKCFSDKIWAWIQLIFLELSQSTLLIYQNSLVKRYSQMTLRGVDHRNLKAKEKDAIIQWICQLQLYSVHMILSRQNELQFIKKYKDLRSEGNRWMTNFQTLFNRMCKIMKTPLNLPIIHIINRTTPSTLTKSLLPK